MKGHLRKLLVLIALLSIAQFSVAKNNAVDSLNTVLKTAKQDTNRVNIILGILNERYCDTTGSSLLLAEASALSQKLKWEKGIVLSEERRGSILNCISQFDNAIAVYLENATRAHKAGLVEYEGNQYRSIANIYEHLTRYKESIVYHNKALVLFQRSGSVNVLNALCDLGNIYSAIEDFPRALDYFRQALEFGRTLHPKNKLEEYSVVVITLLNIGNIYSDMDRYNEALANYDSILVINKELKNNYLEGAARKNMGDVYVNMGEKDKAIMNYEKSIQVLSVDEIMFRPAAFLTLTDLYIDKGNMTKAVSCLAEGQRIVERDSILDLMPMLYMEQGRLYAAKKDYTPAISLFEKAIRMSRESDYISYEVDALEGLYRTYEQAGLPVKAFETYKLFVERTDTMEARRNKKAVYTREMQIDFDKRELADSVKFAQEKQVYGLKLQRQRLYTIGGFTGLVLVLLLAFVLLRNYRQQKKATAIIVTEKHRSEELLLNILPSEVADELKEKGSVQAKAFEEVTVLFTDFVNFTTAGENMTPQALVNELHACFKAFDEIIGKYHIEKIKTVGDAYLAVAGLPMPTAAHAENVVQAALEIRDYIADRRLSHPNAFEVRIGIHSGNIVAGIVGIKKFAYDVWGDTVNIAARMEQNSEKGKVNISEATYELVKDKFNCNYRGEIEAKNKGKLKMYFVE